jgi:hypothetical protein
MNRVWRDYGLSITLGVLFLGSWTLQTWTGWNQFVADQEMHMANRPRRSAERLYLHEGRGDLREPAIGLPASVRLRRARHVPCAP